MPIPLKTAKADSIAPTNLPAIKPTVIPLIPPIKPIIIDSVKNSSLISADFIPIAFIRPTSLVLSIKETVKVLNIPRAATARAHITITRFGSKIGIFSKMILGGPTIEWYFRDDADELTNWTSAQTVLGGSGNQDGQYFSAQGTSDGNIFLVSHAAANIVRFSYFNGTTWSSEINIGSSAASQSFASLSTDGHNVWVFYPSAIGINSSVPGNRDIVYKKGVPPYTANDFDTNPTKVVDYHGNFDKYWSYVSSSFTDDTTDAGSITVADTQIGTGVSDAAYFGKSQKYDAVSWALSIKGVGGSATWTYWNGSAWSPLSINASSNPTFLGNGFVSFTDPVDWETTSINGESNAYYYVRAEVNILYTTPPVGIQMNATPLISWANVISTPDDNGKIQAIWTENSYAKFNIRSTPVTVSTSVANTASSSNISPPVAGYSTSTPSTSNTRRIVRTLDGTLHAFIQGGTINTCGGSSSSNNTIGLNWVYSTDFGNSWNCGGQLSSYTSTLYYPSAVTDSDNNIYVVYSAGRPGTGSVIYDVFYRKLTKGTGTNWTVGPEQTVLDSTLSTTGYNQATITLENTSRIWLAAKYDSGTDYQISVYYSDNLSESPTWTRSIETLDSAGTNSVYHDPVIVTYGSNIGIMYLDQATSGAFRWRHRNFSDSLTDWEPEENILSGGWGSAGNIISAVGDSAGNIYMTVSRSGNHLFCYFNGLTWSSSTTVSNTSLEVPASSLVTDGTNVWAVYPDTSGLSTSLPGYRKLVYKKGVPPFAAGNFDANPTQIVSYHGTFDSYWSMVGGDYTNDTTDAASTSSADTQMVGEVGDIAYFGKSEKFDAVEWALSTSGVGGKVVWEYWNGSTWAAVTDFMRVSNNHFTGHGYITFIPNTDWETTNVNDESTSYYYVRARTFTAYSTPPIGLQMADIPGPIIDVSFLPFNLSGNRIAGIYSDYNGPTYGTRFYGGTPDTTDPETNAADIAMTRSYGGTGVGASPADWTNNSAPYFSWSGGADDSGGSGLKGYCLYLGQSSSGDPGSDKGILGTSPVDTTGTGCEFIVGTTAVDFATTGYRGSTWLTTSADLYYLNIKAVDSSGNVFDTAASFPFRFDNTPPANVGYISCASGNFANVADMSFSWPTSGSAASSDTNQAGVLGWQYQIQSTSGTWLGNTTEPSLGVNNYLANTETSRTLTQDQDGSAVTVGNNVIYFRTVDQAGNASADNTIRTCNLAYGGDAPAFSGVEGVTVTPLTSTSNSYALSWTEASAAVGRSVANYYYMVNTLPPASLTTLQGNAATYIDNGTSLTVAAGALPNVNKGSNTVYVVAIDDATTPNYSPSNYISGTFTLDSTNPDNVGNLLTSDSSIKSSSQWNVTLTWTAPTYQGAGNLTYLIKRSPDGVTYTQVGTTTGLSYVDNTPASALYYYKVFSQDGADALSSGTNAVTITPTGRWTTSPSLETGPSVGSITTQKATITWSTSRKADSKVQYGTSTGNYNTVEPSNSSQVTSHSIQLSGLTAGTTYYYKVKWTDEDGNTGSSSENSFSTAAAPTVKDVSARNLTLATAIIQFTSKDASKVKIYYGETTSFGGTKEVATSTVETVYTAELTGLDDGTKYYYKINTFDSDGTEYQGTTLDFTTLPRPKITGVKVQPVANTAQPTILVTWTTNTEVSSIVTYYPSGSPDQARDEVNIALTGGEHKMLIRSLRPETTYLLFVKGRDKIGNEAVADSQTFTTATDTRPPQIQDLKTEGVNVSPLGSSAQQQTAQFIVSWNTDELATSQVEYGEGTGDSYSQKTQEDANLTLNHLVVISGLTPSKVYHLRVVSKDAASNPGYSIDTVTIAPKATENALNLVISNLQGVFGFLGGIFE